MLDPARLVFIDETGLDTARGAVTAREPSKGGSAATRRRALAHEHVRGCFTPTGLNGSDGDPGADGRCPLQDLCAGFPLPYAGSGDIVSWDNLSSHPMAGVREAIEAVGAVLQPLPPYSPDFNLIEQVIAKLNAWLRKAGEWTVEALWNTLAKVLEQFTPTECETYLRGAGYALQTNGKCSNSISNSEVNL